MVERWFSALTTKKLKRSAHRSVKELAADINAWAAAWNENPKPFVWHKTAEQILERLAAYCSTNKRRQHQRFRLTGHQSQKQKVSASTREFNSDMKPLSTCAFDCIRDPVMCWSRAEHRDRPGQTDKETADQGPT